MPDDVDIRSLLRGLPALEGEYPTFDAAAALPDPVAMFRRWLEEAIEQGVSEPHAVTLSTVDRAGVPDARVLVLKDLDEDGWWFATSSDSRKGRQLMENSTAAMTFFWSKVGRQIRIRGPVRRATADESAADFRARGLGGRAVSIGSRQSEPLRGLDECRVAVEEALERLANEPDLPSPTWTLFALAPDEVEFWQADPDRQHVRLRYERSREGGWEKELLWP